MFYGWKRKSQEKLKKYIKLKENENARCQHLWDAAKVAKVVLRVKFIALNIHITKEENSYNSHTHFKKSEKNKI